MTITEAPDTYEAVRLAPQPTGRRLVIFKKDVSTSDAVGLLQSVTKERVISPDAMGSLGASLRSASASDSIAVLDQFPLAVIGGGASRASAMADAMQSTGAVEDTRPEFWMYAIGAPWTDSGAGTWGVDACGARASDYDGNGVKLCVLDTGIDLGHPDFAGRLIVTETFVPGETVDDLQGHGTHTAGTAAGVVARADGNIPRYGVAPGAELHVGKVLNNRGSGREFDIVAGIEWALQKKCAIVSMSLGRPTSPDEQYDPFYEDIAQKALEAGMLIIAAAGNDSDRRYGYVAPVGSPANAPSIMAVAAIGADERFASFSNGGSGIGRIDISGPGMNVFSSVPRPELYKRLMGTSMACPHVAGIAALWAQSAPHLRGRALWEQLIASARDLGGNGSGDFGAGLVQAP